MPGRAIAARVVPTALLPTSPMHRRLFARLPLAVLPGWPAWAASAGPYDEGADAGAALRSALADAARRGLPVLVVYGANWCGDCLALDRAMRTEPAASLIRSRFGVVKVDVGRFDRNTDLAAAHGVPLERGIPALALLSPQGRPLSVTRGGELASARRMGPRAIHDFFESLASNARP